MILTTQTCAELRGLIHRLCGLVLSEEKAYLVQHRLEPLVRAQGYSTFEEFARQLQGPAGGALHDALVEAITTKETFFFRDGHPFETLRQRLLPELADTIRARKRDRLLAAPPHVRLWSAAAATGQEAYSLAMLLHDFTQANRFQGLAEGDIAVLATDVSAAALAYAQAGSYSAWECERGLTPELLARFFERRGQRWVVQEKVRRFIEFRRLNLMGPLLGLGPFDAILCRNVLIYFDEASRRRLCERFFELLHPGGYLLLGAAENLYGLTARFESVTCADTLLYRRPLGS